MGCYTRKRHTCLREPPRGTPVQLCPSSRGACSLESFLGLRAAGQPTESSLSGCSASRTPCGRRWEQGAQASSHSSSSKHHFKKLVKIKCTYHSTSKHFKVSFSGTLVPSPPSYKTFSSSQKKPLYTLGSYSPFSHFPPPWVTTNLPSVSVKSQGLRVICIPDSPLSISALFS